MSRKHPRWQQDGHVAATVKVFPSDPNWFNTDEEAYPEGFNDLQDKYGDDVAMHSGGVSGYSLDFHRYRDARDFMRRSSRKFPEVHLELESEHVPSATAKMRSPGRSRYSGSTQSISDVATTIYGRTDTGAPWYERLFEGQLTTTEAVVVTAGAALAAYVVYRLAVPNAQ